MGDARAVRFVTFSCDKRWPLFHRDETRDAFVEALRNAEAAGWLLVVAFVVMPEHVHLLLRPAAALQPDAMGVPLPTGLAWLKAGSRGRHCVVGKWSVRRRCEG